MKKKLIVVMLFFTLACQTVMSAPIAPTPTETAIPPTTAPTATEVAQLPPTLAPTPTPFNGFDQTRLSSKDGNLTDQLKDQALFAIALGMMPVVEFDASW